MTATPARRPRRGDQCGGRGRGRARPHRRADRPEVWIRVRTRAEARAAAAVVDAAFARGEHLPLRGLDGRGQGQHRRRRPADHGRPARRSRSRPTISAPCVVALERPGRSWSARPTWTSSPPAWSAPARRYGAVASVVAPDRIGGGSSSGSAVAVALGLVDLALGTDTAGSGRVPAACQGIVGLKPTVGLVSVDGRGARLPVVRLRLRLRPIGRAGLPCAARCWPRPRPDPTRLPPRATASPLGP